MDEWIKETVQQVLSEKADRYLNKLIDQTNEILKEMDELKEETEQSKSLVRDMDDGLRWTEDQIEAIRRDRNKAAVILWNFPDDLHPMVAHQSSSPEEKIDIILDFLTRTVGISDDDVLFLGVEHVAVFFTSYKNQRSVNVRVQFADEEAKSLCESYCIPFLKTFNQHRQAPTRWKDDQTELQREESAKVEQLQLLQQQPPAQARPNRLLFTKVIRWPPPQQA